MLTPLTWGRTATLLKGDATSRDGYGNAVQSWPEVTVDGCAWWPSSTSESAADGGDVVTSRLGILFPDGVEVSALDRVRLPDAPGLWRIDGDPRKHFSPITGASGGLYAWLERVTG